MTIERSIGPVGVRQACAFPYPTVEEALGMADFLAAAGYYIHRHDPPVPMELVADVQVVASVFSTLGARIGAITTTQDPPSP